MHNVGGDRKSANTATAAQSWLPKSPQKKRLQADKVKRSKNIIIYGVEEPSEDMKGVIRPNQPKYRI